MMNLVSYAMYLEDKEPSEQRAWLGKIPICVKEDFCLENLTKKMTHDCHSKNKMKHKQTRNENKMSCESKVDQD